MDVVIGVVVVLLVCSLVIVLAGDKAFSDVRSFFPSTLADPADVPVSEEITRAELQQRLSALRSSRPPAPETLQLGAMCYDMVVPSGALAIVCSHCRRKSVFERDFKLGALEDCHRLVQAIRRLEPTIDVTLDTRFYCRHCNAALAHTTGKESATAPVPKAAPPDAPRFVPSDDAIDGLYLVTTFEDGSSHRVTINGWGLRALLAFLQGEDRVKDETDRETALRDALPHLGAMLGMEPQNPE